MSPEGIAAQSAVALPRHSAAASDYASSSLIAYIGNKRALLPFLKSVFLELDERHPVSRFLDPFAGAGSVSRLARTLGWRVMANDIEPYAWAVNSCWLGLSADDRDSLFQWEGGLDAVLTLINSLHPERENLSDLGTPVEPYISRHYAPADSASADWRRERLFYTRENALFLDRARQAIDELRARPGAGLPSAGPRTREEAERAALLGPLVYEAATHANTSGVFKAFHKGYGGHGRDALRRILAPMRLCAPILWPGPPAELGRSEAALFCAGRSAELCYLDPPYNQHQYASNYHLLNTLVTWDRHPVDERRWADGSLCSKAGIPPDWKERRSAFCSRAAAPAAFKELLAAVDARFIVLSYNSEGLVPAEELYDLLADRADVSLRSVRYLTYRGGRQSDLRRSSNSEILFVAKRRSDRGIPASEEDRPIWKRDRDLRRESELGRLRAETRLARVLSGPFDPNLLLARADGEDRVAVETTSGKLLLETYRGILIEGRAALRCASLALDDMEALSDALEPALLPDNGTACELCARLIEDGARDGRIQRLALGWLRKLAHRKYADRFRALSDRLAGAAAASPRELSRLAAGLAELDWLFAARMAASPGARNRASGAQSLSP